MARKKKESSQSSIPEMVVEKNPITLHPLKCRNEKQKFCRNQIRKHDITIIDGIAGSGKTFITLYEGVYKMLCGIYDKVVLCKSVIATPDQEIGFIPGSVEEKMNPHMMSYKGNLEKMLEKGEESVRRLFNDRKVEVLPLAYIRGVTLDNAYIIIDEAQNISMELFKSIITRIGENSKMIFLGDTEQVDFDSDKKRKTSALQHIIDIFKNEDCIGMVHFEDDECVRNPIIPKILDKLREFDKKEKRGN